MVTAKHSAHRVFPFTGTFPGQLEISLVCPPDRPGERSWFLSSFGWIVGDVSLGGMSSGRIFAEELDLQNRPFPDEESAFESLLRIARRYRLTLPSGGVLRLIGAKA
jgi:hypothetical protein